MVMIRDKKALEAHLALWKDGEPADKKPIGYVLSIEGADSFITVNHVERAYAYGLRRLARHITAPEGMPTVRILPVI